MLKPAVLITGASTGIGHDCAVLLAEQGYFVYAGIRTRHEPFPHHVASCIQAVVLDVTDQQSVNPVVMQIEADQLAKKITGLAALVNNAGVVLGGPLEFLPLDDLREQFEINVFGVMRVTQAMLPLLRKNPEPARIVNISSIAGRSTLPFTGPYSASKHAIEALSDALRMELNPWGIGVSLIEPGSIATPIWNKSILAAEVRSEVLPEQAMGLYGDILKRFRIMASNIGAQGIPPRCVSRSILHAIQSPRPKTRYLVGWDACLRTMANILPDRWIDQIILNRLGL